MENKTAIIVGATGLVGRFLLSYLVMDKSYQKIIAISRTPLPLKDSKIENICVPLSDLQKIQDQLVGVDVYCCLGTTIGKAGSQEKFKEVDYTYPFTLASICKSNGANSFTLVSAMGANSNSKIFYNRVKGELERDLLKLNYASLNILQPSLLTGLRKEFRLGERIAQSMMNIFKPIMVAGLSKYKPIEAMVVAFTMHGLPKNQSITLTSDKIQNFYNEHKQK